MIVKLLVFLILFVLFTLSKCDCMTEDIDLEMPNLGKVAETLKIRINNPFGTVMGVGTIGSSLAVKGTKTFSENQPIVMHSEVHHDKNSYSLSFVVVNQVSSSSQNYVSIVSHMCWLMFAFFSELGRNPLFFAPVLNYAGAQVIPWNITPPHIAPPHPNQHKNECPSVHLRILIPDQYLFSTRPISPGVIEFTLRRKFGKHVTVICEGPLRNTFCTPWEFHNDPHKKCGGKVKGHCPSPKTCEVSPYSAEINFQCLDEKDRVAIIGGSHGTTFGYNVPASESNVHTYSVPGREGERCHGPIERMGNCAAGLYCKKGRCHKGIRRDGTAGYDVANKEKYYCQYPVGQTVWVYYFSVEHWCTLQENISDPGTCPYATNDSTVYGGPTLMDGVAREAFIVNGTVPGPHIYACVGDSFEIIVTSFNMSTGTSIHWHGMWNRFNQMADGVAQVTQCPITPGNTWTYLYRAEPAGTTWYHSHTGLQYGDGLFGGITIFQSLSTKHWCSAVDFWYEQKHEGLNWALWKNNYCNPYRKHYDSILDSLLIHDWFHLMSTDIYSNSFFGVQSNNAYGQETPYCKFSYKGSGDFQCIGGGAVGDMPWVSGLINGFGQYFGRACGVCSVQVNETYPEETGPICGTCIAGNNSDGSYNPCYQCGADLYYFVKVPKLGKIYRMSVVNTGQMYGLRFSIDHHTLKIIMADQMYAKALKVQEFVVYPGQRIEFLINITKKATQNYWIRARTFPLQAWTFETNTSSRWFGSFVPGEWSDNVGEVVAVLQYSPDINGGMPPSSERYPTETYSGANSGVLHNVVTITNSHHSVYTPAYFADYAAPTVQHYRLHSYYNYTAIPLNKTQNMTVYLDGIMYPNFQLAMNLAKGIVNITGTNIPVVFARPHVPISISKGQWGLRNMTIFEGFQEVSPGDVKVGNYTTATYLGGNRPNVLYIANPGAMVHPLHLHGHTFALLASGRTNLKQATILSNRENEKFGCCHGSDNPVRANHGGALYFDYWSAEVYDADLSEWVDAIPNSHPNASIIIPGVGSRFVADPVVRDPYGEGEVHLHSPMLEDTLSVPPNGWALIEFISDNPGSWFFHCHIEFHATGGMGFVYITDPDSWSVVYPTGRTAQPGFQTYNNGVGADYCCYDVEYLGSVQYW